MAGTAEALGEELLVQLGQVEPALPCVILAADSGSASGETVIHHAAELAREQDGQLVVVHVRITDGLTRARSAGDLNKHQKLAAELGGTYIQAQGTDLEQSLAKTAREHDAAIIVVGRRQSRLVEFFFGSVSTRLQKLLPAADVQEVPL
jgi:K+-sensing histidine kinase KdpD